MKKTLYYLVLLFFAGVLFCVSVQAGSINFKTVRFSADGGPVITADYYGTESRNMPLIILFHQYMSSRGEYRKIAPMLVKMGFNCLAVDTRAGSRDRWSGVENETSANAPVVRAGDYLNAYPDLVAAVDYAKGRMPGKGIILWGSSFSASLVFKLASQYRKDVVAVLSFSPGEYIRKSPGLVAKWASMVSGIPCFVACGARESRNVKPVFEAIGSRNKVFYVAENGRHGSSILMDDERNWNAVRNFLDSVCKGLKK